MDELEEASDEINFFIQEAAAQNSAIDPTSIAAQAGQLEGLGDEVTNEAQNLLTLIANGQRSAARASYRALRALLNEQISIAKQIRLEAIALKELIQTYDVRIELLYGGQVYTGSTTLGGFYAYNQDLGQYFYPDFNADDQFFNLPGGTYTFGSFDGYFDGTDTNEVTLSQGLVGNDGFIIVQLNYWSE